MSVYLFTHHGLDSIGTVVLAKAAKLLLNKVEYHEYATIDDAVLRFIKKKEYSQQDLLLITDITPSDTACAEINSYNKEIEILLLDHHQNRNYATKYPWTKNENDKCATMLLYETLKDCKHFTSSTEQFAQTINSWDLWLTESVHRKRAERINSLLSFIGREEFITTFSEKQDADSVEPFATLIKYIEQRKNIYVDEVFKEHKQECDVYVDGLNNKFRVVFVKEYASEVAKKILDDPEYGDIDYIVVVNPQHNRCSLRSRKNGTDVRTIAQAVNGGGGWKKDAAGFQIPIKEQTQSKIITILNKINY